MRTCHILSNVTLIIMKNDNNMKPAANEVADDEIHAKWGSDSFTRAEVILYYA